MKTVFWGIVIALNLITAIEGLRCWSCNNAKSKRECFQNGRVETCQKGQEMSCQTEIRYGAVPGNRPLIFKRCKQKMACQNDRRQNKDQCIDGRKESVCRCCCLLNNCNRANFWCRPTPGRKLDGRCGLLKKPLHGVKTCEFKKNEGEVGSKCIFSCEEGFEMQGNRVSTCKRSKTGLKFNNPAPRCTQVLENVTLPLSETTAASSTAIPSVAPTTTITVSDCEIAPPAPTSGGYSCIRSRDEVICTYFCGEDETIVGTGILTCRTSTGWNGTTPECISECGDFPDNPVNGTRQCIGDGGLGTTCSFLCDPGFELIGEERIVCAIEDNRIIWNSSAPICESRKNIPK